MERVALPAIICCSLALTGCRDRYAETIKRLELEQKQYDWIEGKIKGIRQREKEQDAEYAKSIDDIATSSSTTNDTTAKNNERMIDIYAKLREKNIKDASEERRPWEEWLVRQRVAVERAEKAVDGAR